MDSLYAAAVGADDWKNVLESYTRLVGGHASLLSFYDIPAQGVRTLEWHNFSESYISASNARWKAFNPWSVAGQRLLRDPKAVRTGGFVSAGSRLVPQGELLKTEWYNDFAAEHGVQDCLTTIGLSGGTKGLALIANTGGRTTQTYSSDQVLAAEGVLKDVQRAITLHVSAAESSQLQSLAPGYMQMKLPVLAIHERRILTANDAARGELELGRLIRRVSGKLFARDSQLDQLIAMMERDDAAHHRSLIATSPDGCRFLAQAIRFNRLRGSLMAMAGADEPAILLVLTGLDDGLAGRAAAVRALSCFTPVEHAIATSLINGRSIEDIASERRASVHTIRWHLRNMSSKVGEGGVKGLIRVLTLLLPY